jgi:hypothetical protein
MLILMMLLGSFALFVILQLVTGFFWTAARLEQVPPSQFVVSNRDASLNLRDKPPR